MTGSGFVRPHDDPIEVNDYTLETNSEFFLGDIKGDKSSTTFKNLATYI